MGFILTATGVHASCPIEVSPSSVVVKYGDPVSINCSTTEDLVELMGWETTDSPKTLNRSGHLTWTVESITNWNIYLSCFVTPLSNATSEQCSVTPKFVLYTFPEKISISSSSGSDGVMNVTEEHNFICHINHVAPVQNLTVRWYKGDKLIHTDAFNSSNKKPENQTSVYSFTATRQDNGITFRCEAHMDLGPEGPQLNVSSEEKRVTVHFGPDIKCLFPINILEGETLESHCPVEGNPPPSVRWMKNGQLINASVPLYRGDAGMYTVEAGGVSLNKRVLIFYGPLKCQIHHHCTGVCLTTQTLLRAILNLTPTMPRCAVVSRNDTLEPSVQDPMRVTDCYLENITHCNISVVSTPVNVLSTIRVNLSREQNGAELRCEAWVDLGPDGPGLLLGICQSSQHHCPL
ncbi:hemicentin-1-like protein [Lates japonicus]|uniref:Hemicentin-1-like protein n=1 Tax=Lates japonicus TaxID=270547 RepID=A0AAD3M7M8_LATJO|nr:hemicentin-1-like protein [Lates japonicus]